jgi:hypothetical protein
LPLTAPFGVECRTGEGANADTHQVVVSFVAPFAFAGVLVAPENGKSADLDGPPIPNANNTEVTINLKNVTDNQTLRITLQSLAVGGGPAADAVVPMMVVAGDTDGDGRNNVVDTNETKSRSGQVTDDNNFRSDVNLDGRINVADTNFVKAHAGSPPPTGRVTRARK